LAEIPLDHLDLNVLAMHCQRLSGSPDAEVAEQARRLKQEWSSLISTPGSEFATQEALRNRMVRFLGGTKAGSLREISLASEGGLVR
jgi:hypothetical protein